MWTPALSHLSYLQVCTCITPVSWNSEKVNNEIIQPLNNDNVPFWNVNYLAITENNAVH